MKKLYIIDGNNYIHRAYHALPPLTRSDGKPVGALYGLVRMILAIIRKGAPDFLAVVFDTHKPTFRHREYSEYKATRPKPDDELVFQLRNMDSIVAALGIKTIGKDGWEADDVMATLAERYKEKTDVYLVSADKDLSQLVGGNVRIYNELKNKIIDTDGVREKYGVSPEEFIDWQALVGDKSDNVPGARGIGPKGAAKLIKEYGSVEKIYDSIGDIPEKVGKKLIAARDEVMLSKKLVKLDREVPLELELDELVPSVDDAKIKAVAGEWEFSSLSQTPLKTEKNGAVKERVRFTDNAVEIFLRKNIAVRFADTKHLKGIAVAARDAAAFIDIFQGELDFGGRKDEPLLEVLEDPSASVITDDAKKLYRLTSSAGRICRSAISDISLMGYVIDSEVVQTLPQLSAKYLKQVLPEPDDPAVWAGNTALMFALKEKLLDEISGKGLSFLYDSIEFPLARVLAAMETSGIKLDKGILEKLSTETATGIESLKKEIFSLTGEEFNVNSTHEIRRILFEKLNLPSKKRTKTGASVDAQVLKELSPLHPVCGKIIKYRTLSKLKSTYIDAFPALAGPDGRLRTNFNSTGTLTGRLSSSNPNLQNIPARGEHASEIRSAFIAGKGKTLVSGDYSQIDLRVLAHFCGDEKLVEAFRSDEDIHAFTASLVFGVPADEVDKQQRRVAKTVNFGIIYGMSAFGLAADLEIPAKEAREIIKKYWEIFPGVGEYVKKSVADAKETGYTRTLFGRRRRVSGRTAFEKRVAVNTPIQGSSSDIIKKAMVDIFPHLDDFGAALILQIHDELLFEVDVERAEEFSRFAKEKMENAVKLNVPLKVNMKTGPNFSDMKSTGED